MQKVYNSLKEIEGVVAELLPPRLNHLINNFKLEFKLSSTNWDQLNPIFKDLNEVVMLGERDIKYYISKATIQDEIDYLTGLLDSNYELSDNHFYYISQVDIRKIISKLQLLL
jgi:hypothetical protein